MGGFVSWVDSSPADRERMRRVVALFQEKEARDELGLGVIRDAFSEGLFPGTSVLLTRLRYFLFVPWMYLELERSGATAKNVEVRAQTRELELIDPLLENEDNVGTIGKRARDQLDRRPSSTYWAGLRRWGICLFAGSQEECHRAFDALRAKRRTALRPDDQGVATERYDAWHPRIPDAPPDWPDVASFELTGTEARFIQGRIGETCPGTALAFFAQHGGRSDVRVAWDHPDAGRLPVEPSALLDLARRFSLLFHGAALLYNVMLSELSEQEERVAKYREALVDWARSEEAGDLRSFELAPLWSTLARLRANVSPATRGFVRGWVELLRDADLSGIAGDDNARRLVEDRERSIKKARSRFANRRARDQWGGASGAGRLDFRWGVTQRLLNDLHAGLERE